eukprot:UC4_evm1s52
MAKCIDCGAHGSCFVNENDEYSCKCDSQYSGEVCDKCTNGFAGTDCAFEVGSPCPCTDLRRGICVIPEDLSYAKFRSEVKNISKTCQKLIENVTIEADFWKLAQVIVKEECLRGVSEPKCKCDPGFMGDECEIVIQDQCDGFGGDFCDCPVIEGNICGVHGTCVGRSCGCDLGWKGARCDKVDETKCGPKASGPCNSIGSLGPCIAEKDNITSIISPRCQCKKGFTGDLCGACAENFV